MNPQIPPGGLRCSEVLERLSEFLDGGLPIVERRAIEAHVASCPDCTRFGGVFAVSLARLRDELHSSARSSEELGSAAAARLADALRRAR